MAATAETLSDPSAEPVGGAPSGDGLGARLLDAAVAVFAEKGYDRAGVAEIARRAGVTTGAIYSRYASKAELLVAALDARAPDELDALFTDDRFDGRPADVLAIAGSHLVRRSVDGIDCGLLTEAFVATRRDPAVAALLRQRVTEGQERLRTVIEAAKASGGIVAELDTDALVTFCQALGFGFVLFDAVDAPRAGTGPWEQLIAHLIASLAAPSGEAPAPVPSPPVPPTEKDPS